MKELFRQWLLNRGMTMSVDTYPSSLEALEMDIAPSNTSRWPGIFEYLIGEKPSKGPFQVSGLNEFCEIYGQFLLLIDSTQKRYWSFDHDKYDKCYWYTHAVEKGTDHKRLISATKAYRQFLVWKELHDKGVVWDASCEIAMNLPCLQRIYYGAPGTGKSKGVNDTASKLPKENVIRTTFHPDSDYSTFVGAYKPKMDIVPRTMMKGEKIEEITQGDAKLLTEKRISYEFVPQAFAKAYVQAWKMMATPDVDDKVAPVMLVIEEINRGDCAKIFGDLFQLLDRLEKDDPDDSKKKAGFSEYPVLADSDLADYIRRELDTVRGAAVFEDYPSVIAADNLELMLPPNMYIWATMNTSDQSLFPMDSAFKRRWDWKYVPIKNHPEENWKIVIGTEKYSWWDFLEKINKEVFHLTSSEDKQLGYFFVKTPDRIVGEDTFVNKVLFFLWNVVWKDCYSECEYLKNGDDYFTFRDFFNDDGTANAVNVNKVLKALDIKKWSAATPSATAPASTAETASATGEGATPAAQ